MVSNESYSIEDVKISEFVAIDQVNALDIVFNNHYSKTYVLGIVCIVTIDSHRE